ncbi:MAG TPA: glycosyltransferase family 4 protein [Baekduia sp.]|nr:glycosyltransferase family 4 protein [Baekduia sp.]
MTTAARGGGEYAAVDLLDALVRRGHECVMLSNVPTIGDGTRVPVRPIELGPKLSRSSFVSLTAKAPLVLRDLRRALEREAPYDVLLVHYKKEQLLAPWLPRRLRPTLAWAEWGPVPRQLRGGVAGALYRRAARDVGAVLAVSAGTKDSLVEAGIAADIVEVVPNVMDMNAVVFDAGARARVRGELGIPEGAFCVGCVSRLHPKKPIDVLIRAAAALGPDAHVLIAGDGDAEASLKALAASLLGERAHFLPTPHRAIGDVLSALDVSVFCPSPTEGAPRAVIYAMQASRPVVSTGPEGVWDMIEPGMGEIAAPEHDVDAVAAVLAGYRDDPERVAREGRRGRELAEERYDGDKIAVRIEALLRRR